jgi:hypothetical protein
VYAHTLRIYLDRTRACLEDILLWAYTHVLGMLREQNRGVAGVGRGTLIFFSTVFAFVFAQYLQLLDSPAAHQTHRHGSILRSMIGSTLPALSPISTP